MAIIFYNDLKKANGDIPKLLAESTALWRLRSFLNAQEPKLAAFLVHLWQNQGKAITYKELREAILNNELSMEALEQWQQDYSKFAKKYMEPIYTKAIEEASVELKAKYPLLFENSTEEKVQAFAEKQSARFVTNSTNEQIGAVRQAVRSAVSMNNVSVDALSRVIRPMVGLTIQQTRANMNYFENCINHGMSEKRALDASLRYAARQHRYRAYNIARTEMAFAYNQGEHEGVVDAINRGYMGYTVKRWVTADDERVCSICSELDGKEIEIDEGFGFRTRLPRSFQIVPPAHPSCLFPGNKVVAADVVGGSIRRFEGDAITIRTSTGNEITCTPNHPILTDSGWVAAGELNKSHKLIEASDIEGLMDVLKADHYNMEAPIEQIANAFLMSRGVTARRVPISAEDFHGDGIDNDVSVIYSNSLLWNNGKIEGFKGVDDGELGSGNIAIGEGSLNRLCGSHFLFNSGDSATGGIISRNGKSFSLVESKTAHADNVRFATATERDSIIGQDFVNSGPLKTQTLMQGKAGFASDIRGDNLVPNGSMFSSETVLGMDSGVVDPVLLEPSIQGTFIDAELIRNLIDGKSKLIQLASVVEIDRKYVVDHVYNLQTKSNLYLSGNIITHNCRCAVIYIEKEPPKYGPEFNVSGPAAQ